ncbi:hypothetical protein PHJA_000609200 [Phtheirospermum japonicum]|uniref:Uncharacterized protein n=1 Tax=Phtheirospermum japonicum TaxID=374723 RepID=A0A830BKM6_9LAMI|nr:hypothetical protein PHJA_000609200 [Phtheirospermum japonicum]
MRLMRKCHGPVPQVGYRFGRWILMMSCMAMCCGILIFGVSKQLLSDNNFTHSKQDLSFFFFFLFFYVLFVFCFCFPCETLASYPRIKL